MEIALSHREEGNGTGQTPALPFHTQAPRPPEFLLLNRVPFGTNNKPTNIFANLHSARHSKTLLKILMWNLKPGEERGPRGRIKEQAKSKCH